MSDLTQHQKGTHNKAKGLGRGLGSLLSGGEDGSFAKSAPGAENALASLTEKYQKAAPAASPSQNAEATVAQADLALAGSTAPGTAPAPSSTPAVASTSQVTAPPLTPLAPAVPTHLRIWQIAIEKVEPNPKQPRQIFDKEPLQELANSIQEKGIIQPLLVRKKGEDKFEIIAGERRWRAAQMAGLKEVPAILKDSEDQEVLELALIENIQRENLNVIEEAEAYDFLLKKYNLTQMGVAQKVGKDRATVANVLRLLQLVPAVRHMVSKNELSLGQAKVLLSVSDETEQQRLADKACKESLSVRALEKLVAREKSPEPPPLDEDGELRAMLAKDLGEELQKLIGSKVGLDYDRGKGKIVIHFYADEELNQIADRLRDSWLQK